MVFVRYSSRTKSVSVLKYGLSNSLCKRVFHDCSMLTSILFSFRQRYVFRQTKKALSIAQSLFCYRIRVLVLFINWFESLDSSRCATVAPNECVFGGIVNVILYKINSVIEIKHIAVFVTPSLWSAILHVLATT